MTTAEVREMHPHLEEYGFDFFGRCCFWTDDQSNYAALYVVGPLAGRVCVLDHDGPDPTPAYRSVASFLHALAAAGIRGFSSDRTPFSDYPALGPVGAADSREDAEATWALWPLLEAAVRDSEREQYAYAIIVLTPYEQTNALLPFTEDEDFYIVEKACDVLGLRRWEPAVNRLAEVALRGISNGRVAAIRALGRIGTGEALGELVRVHEALPAREANGWLWLFKGALAACGCEVDDSNKLDMRYRVPGGKDWKSLRR
jgi:hypothetical protein